MMPKNVSTNFTKPPKKSLISICDFMGYFRKTLYVLVIFFKSLLMSYSAKADYQVKMNIDLDVESASIALEGKAPKSLVRFDQYTIDKFDLKIGNNNYTVTQHSDNSLSASIKLEDLHYSIDQWPSSYVVFTWDLSFSQAMSEISKSVRKHHSWSDIFWWFRHPFRDCLQAITNAYFFHQTDSIEITANLKEAVKQEQGSLGQKLINMKHKFEENLCQTDLCAFEIKEKNFDDLKHYLKGLVEHNNKLKELNKYAHYYNLIEIVD